MQDKVLMIKEYNAQVDILYLRIANEYKYKESVELGDNIILDFDQHYMPVALEILDASKFLGINKLSLMNKFGLDMEINIRKDRIAINALFLLQLHQKQLKKPLDISTINDLDIPHMQTNFEMAEA